MAQYLHLPLYKTTYTLLLELMQVTKNFPKEFRYSIGEKIQNEIVELLLEIYKANNSIIKNDFIKKILEHAQFIDIYLRISFDIKILSQEKYVRFIEQTGSISKQAQAWLNSL